MNVVDEYKQRKAALRDRLEHVFADLSPQQVQQQSAIITQQMLQHPKFIAAKSISTYLSTSKEVQTTEILRAALNQGKACYVPRYGKGCADMQMVRLHSMEDYDNLPLTRWNIKQPRVSESRESVFDVGRLDVVILPGMAFSRDGARLGHGKGYYDRFLLRCRHDFATYPWTVGLALREQILPESDIPMESSDQRLDNVMYAEEQ